jgi:hypothetical protein
MRGGERADVIAQCQTLPRFSPTSRGRGFEFDPVRSSAARRRPWCAHGPHPPACRRSPPGWTGSRSLCLCRNLRSAARTAGRAAHLRTGASADLRAPPEAGASPHRMRPAPPRRRRGRRSHARARPCRGTSAAWRDVRATYSARSRGVAATASPRRCAPLGLARLVLAGSARLVLLLIAGSSGRHKGGGSRSGIPRLNAGPGLRAPARHTSAGTSSERVQTTRPPARPGYSLPQRASRRGPRA